MTLTSRISEAFILTFGITRPRGGNERIARIYIVGMLALSIAAAVAMFMLIVRLLR